MIVINTTFLNILVVAYGFKTLSISSMIIMSQSAFSILLIDWILHTTLSCWFKLIVLSACASKCDTKLKSFDYLLLRLLFSVTINILSSSYVCNTFLIMWCVLPVDHLLFKIKVVLSLLWINSSNLSAASVIFYIFMKAFVIGGLMVSKNKSITHFWFCKTCPL